MFYRLSTKKLIFKTKHALSLRALMHEFYPPMEDCAMESLMIHGAPAMRKHPDPLYI